jgi:hypothetical protein
VNRTLEAKARALAGLKGYVTNLQACPDGTPVTAEFVIGAYGRLFQIEKSFRMSKHDLQARPIYARKRDSIEAHLNVVFAALAPAAGSSTAPAGASRSSSAPPAATAPSTSSSAPTPSPPPTLSPTTYATPSTASTPNPLRTSLMKVGPPAGSRPRAGLTSEPSAATAMT